MALGWVLLPVITGCIGAPRVTAQHAAACVPLTFAYRNIVREAAPVRMEVDEGDAELVELHVIGRAGRVGFFRVWRSDRRIEMWDWQTQAWVAVGVCD